MIMKVDMSMNEPKTFRFIENINVVHVNVHFLEIELVQAKFTQNERNHLNALFSITDIINCACFLKHFYNFNK